MMLLNLLIFIQMNKLRGHSLVVLVPNSLLDGVILLPILHSKLSELYSWEKNLLAKSPLISKDMPKSKKFLEEILMTVLYLMVSWSIKISYILI